MTPLVLNVASIRAADLARNRVDLTPQDLPCTLDVENASIRLGEAPTIHVSITNTTDETIYLVGSTDGSGMNRRYPICDVTITGPDGEDVNRPIAMCGNMNPIRPEDFVRIGPGATFDPYRTIDDHGFFANIKLRPENFDKVGTYILQFTYATDSDVADEWSPAPEMNGRGYGLNLLLKVPRVRVQSETVKVVVGP